MLRDCPMPWDVVIQRWYFQAMEFELLDSIDQRETNRRKVYLMKAKSYLLMDTIRSN